MIQLYNEALAHLNLGQFQQSIQKFKKCIQESFNVFNSIQYRSQAYFYYSNFQSAMTSYDELIQKFPTSEVGYANKAFCLTVLGSYNEVENLFKTALNLNENNWKTHLYFGYFLGKLKRYEQSLKSLQQAITRNNLNDPISYIVRAQIFCHTNNYQASIRDIKYARQALQQQQNQKLLYQFQIKQIKYNLTQYQRITQTLNQLQLRKQLTVSKNNYYKTQLTKYLNKTVILNNDKIFVNFVKNIQTNQLNKIGEDAKTKTDIFFQDNSNHISPCQCGFKCNII